MRRTTTALLAALLLLPVAPVQAGPPACDRGPLELVGGGSVPLVAGQDHVQGYVLRRLLGAGRTCVVPGATVELLARVTGSSTPMVARTATTDAEGRVQFRVRPPYTVVLWARAVAHEAQSAQILLEVSTRVTLTRQASGGCREAVRGRTYPAKPGTLVHVQRDPQAQDSARVGSFRVGADGTWSGTVTLPCRRQSQLLAWIQSTARNVYGDSSRPGPVATRTTTCGQARGSSGQVAALTHVFEPFNTTTAPHGRWWGERVVTNRTDQPIAFEAYDTDSYQVLRRGSTALVGGSGFTDAIGVSEHVLDPGEELRTVLALSSGNCFAPVPEGYAVLASSPGPAFPAGTAVAAQSLLKTDHGWSVSPRVPLTVS